MGALPESEKTLCADHPEFFTQLATYVVLKAVGATRVWGELVFVEAGSGLIQTVSLGSTAEALVETQLERLVGFLEARRLASWI